MPAADAKRVSRLLADLDNDDFQVRTKAEEELETLGETIADDLDAALKKPLSLEAGRRIKHLMDRIRDQRKTPSAERIRVLRAVEVLEQIGTPEVRRLLTDLAGGAPKARLSEEAKASLERLVKRVK
jgi:hypothetical protein